MTVATWTLGGFIILIILLELGFLFIRQKQGARLEEHLTFQIKSLNNRVNEMDGSIASRVSSIGASVGRGLDESLSKKMTTRRADQEGLTGAVSRLETAIEKLDIIKAQYENERFIGLESRVAMIEMRFAVRNGKADQTIEMKAIDDSSQP